MKLASLIAVAALSLVSLVSCERRDGKIIIHEDQAKQKTEEAAQKTTEEAKKLGHEIQQGAEKVDEKLKDTAHDAGRGVGGGPTEHCDAGVNCPP
ncbi:MAG: hypothetical protein ACXWUG_31455 [Polyangiales bacterium]